LKLLSELDLNGRRVLDFGSGSGVLTLAAALLGARESLGVEIDGLAVQNAEENRRLNGLSGPQVAFRDRLPDLGDDETSGRYDLIVANILKPVLIGHVSELRARLSIGGTVILSGLMEPDVADVRRAYAEAGIEFDRVEKLGEWRALMSRKWVGKK